GPSLRLARGRGLGPRLPARGGARPVHRFRVEVVAAFPAIPEGPGTRSVAAGADLSRHPLSLSTRGRNGTSCCCRASPGTHPPVPPAAPPSAPRDHARLGRRPVDDPALSFLVPFDDVPPLEVWRPE